MGSSSIREQAFVPKASCKSARQICWCWLDNHTHQSHGWVNWTKLYSLYKVSDFLKGWLGFVLMAEAEFQENEIPWSLRKLRFSNGIPLTLLCSLGQVRSQRATQIQGLAKKTPLSGGKSQSPFMKRYWETTNEVFTMHHMNIFFKCLKVPTYIPLSSSP